MRNSRIRPTVNVGSMADIAFLLLIFFLVTTTMNIDQGIARTLDKPCPDPSNCSLNIAQNNILSIAIGNNSQLFVNEMFEEIKNLKNVVIEFVDNNASKTCDYCQGAGLPFLSDSPQKAMISIETLATAKYDTYLAVQDELTAAYFELRAAYGYARFGTELNLLNPQQIKQIKEAYPFKVMETTK